MPISSLPSCSTCCHLETLAFFVCKDQEACVEGWSIELWLMPEKAYRGHFCVPERPHCFTRHNCIFSRKSGSSRRTASLKRQSCQMQERRGCLSWSNMPQSSQFIILMCITFFFFRIPYTRTLLLPLPSHTLHLKFYDTLYSFHHLRHSFLGNF